MNLPTAQTDEQNPEAELPETAQTIVRTIGYAATVELIRHFGGQRIKLAKTEGSAAFEAIAEIVGPVFAKKLGDEFRGNCDVYIPLCFRALKRIKRAKVVERYDELLKKGHGTRTAANIVAAEFATSYRSIELIINAPTQGTPS